MRQEARFPVDAVGTIKIQATGKILHAVPLNMSSSGALFQVDGKATVEVGDWVSFEVVVEHPTEQPLPYWGEGNVVRIDGSYVAIRLSAGGLVP